MPRTSTALLLFLTAAPLAAADRPLVIAHRGGSASRPENTLPAFQHAVRIGVSMLEFDMNLTSDGRIVIHHDSTVNAKICKAPEGSGVTARPIGLMTLLQLEQFDCGSFDRPNSPRYKAVPEAKMPTLDEFLSAVVDSKVPLLGETKMPPEGAEYAPDPVSFVDLVIASLKKFGVEDRFILQSADYRTLDAMRQKNPKVGICLLNARRFKPRYLELVKKHHATHIMLRTDDATPEQLQALRAAGVKILSSTANTREDWKAYVDMKMDGILTDDPEGLMEFLGQQPAK